MFLFFSGLIRSYETMPLYESTFITRQDMSRQDITKLCDSFTSIVEGAGGKIIKNEYWGLRNFAYRINKSRKGHYTMLGIDAPAAAIKEMERQIGINEDVLRALTIRVDAMDETPSVMMQQVRSREDGYGSDDNTATTDDSAATKPSSDETVN
jgi:small subunit ribosomal protein S6